MDAIDRKILAVVQEDASLSVAEIGQRVGCHRRRAGSGLQRLEADGVITRRVAIIDRKRSALASPYSSRSRPVTILRSGSGNSPMSWARCRKSWSSIGWPATSTTCCALS